MLNSVSANVFNFSIVSKICLVHFFLPHLILLQPSLRVAGASEQRAFRRYKKAIPRALALTKFLSMEAQLTPSPHVVTSCWLCPHHPFLYWYISTGTYCIHVNAVWKDKYQTGDSGERALWGALVILFLPLLSVILPSDVLIEIVLISLSFHDWWRKSQFPSLCHSL